MDQLRNLQERILSYLCQVGLAATSFDDGPIVLKSADAVLFVAPFAHGADTFCRIAAVALTEVEPTVAVLQRVLKANTEALLGSVLLFETGTVAASVSLLGNHLDFDEFHSTLLYVAQAADRLGPELRALGGGNLGAALLRETPA